MAQLFMFLIICSLFTTMQTAPAAEEGVSCQMNSKDIGQFIVQEEEEIKAPEDLFKGAKFGWQKKVVEFIKEKLDKWLWSWASRSEAIRAKFNEMMQKSLDWIALLTAEGVSVRHAIVPFVERLKEYLSPMISEMDKFWMDKLRQTTGESTGSEPMIRPTNVQENLNDNNKDGENKAEFGAREHTELLNDNFDSMEDLIEKFKSGEMEKELVVEDGKPQQKRMPFADSTIGKHFHALRTKVLTMVKVFLARTKAGNLIAAFAKLPGILHQQNSGPWAWMVSCARKIRGRKAETIHENKKQLAVEKLKDASPAAGFRDFEPSSAAVTLHHRRVKRARRTYFIFVGGSNPPVFGHQYSYGVSGMIGLGYYVGWLIYGASMYLITYTIWESSEYSDFTYQGRHTVINGPPYWCGQREGCARPYAVAFGIFGIFSCFFLLFLPFLNIY